jgi:hypothetical protein
VGRELRGRDNGPNVIRIVTANPPLYNEYILPKIYNKNGKK